MYVYDVMYYENWIIDEVYEKKKLILRLKLYVLNFIFCDLEKYRFNVKLFILIFFFKFVCICNLKIYVCLIGF